MAYLEYPRKYPQTQLFLIMQLPILPKTKPSVFGHFRTLVNGYNPDDDMEEALADEFEKQAYGKSHTITSLGISDIVPEPGSPWRR
jgi:hypothetical protein